MWDLWRHITRGHISWRRFSLLATSVMMAVFVITATFSQTAYAADATRDKDGSTLSYDGNNYSRINKESFTSDEKTKGLPIASSGDFDGYQFIDSENVLHLILTDGDATKATSGKVVTYTLKNGVYDPASQSEIKNVSIETGKADNSGTCKLLQVGWLVCPVMTFLADFMDKIMDILRNFLTVRALSTNTHDNPVYEIWEKVRDLANICFIIAFLIIVYSQVTNFGISSYGLKVMLPRLIVAAILVNASYWIAGLAIDISNLLGTSVQDMFTAVRKGLSGYDKVGTDLGWSKLTSVVLAGGGILGATIAANEGVSTSLTLLTPALVGALLAATVAVVILAARQALITLSILIAPLAFVAYILPSTNKYFDKWKDLFLTMLLMFPIVSFVFGAAQLAGYAIIVNAGDSPIQIIIGMAVQIAPIAVTPFLIRISGNLLGKIAGIVNDPSRGLVDRTRSWAQDRAKYQAAKNRAGAPLIDKKNGRLTNNALTRRSAKLKKAAERTADGLNRVHTSKLNPNSHMNNVIRRRHHKKVRQQALTTAYESMANNNATDWDNKRFGSSSARNIEGNETARKSEIDNAFYNTDHGFALERRTRSATIQKTEIDNRFDRINKDLTARQQAAEIDKTNVQAEFNATHIGHQIDKARRTAERAKQITEQDLETSWHELNLRDPGNQEQEMTLRVRTDEAAAKKSQVEAVYKDLKANVQGQIVGSRLNAAVESQLKQRAFDAAQIVSASAGREAEATRVLNAKINTELLSNGKVYQKDANGNIVNDANGQPIVISQRKIDGNIELHTYATGVGSSNMMLARAQAQHAKDQEAESAAAFTLMKHFDLSSNDYHALATTKDATVTRTKNGNTITFNFNDEAVKTAAISWIAKNGSRGQKLDLSFSGADGAANSGWAGFITRELMANGFGALEPWANDVTIDLMSRGLVTKDSVDFHSFREIMEGRLKSEKLAGSSDGGIAHLHKVFQDYSQNGSDWQNLVNSYLDYLRDTKGYDNARLMDVEQNIRDMFRVRYSDLIEAHDEIEANENLSKLASGQALNQLRRGVTEYSTSTQGRADIERRRELREARKHLRDGTASAQDRLLIQREDNLYKL